MGPFNRTLPVSQRKQTPFCGNSGQLYGVYVCSDLFPVSGWNWD